jgi:hypothetical protein
MKRRILLALVVIAILAIGFGIYQLSVESELRRKFASIQLGMTELEVEKTLGLPAGVHTKRSYYVEVAPGKNFPTGWEALYKTFSKDGDGPVRIPDHAINGQVAFGPSQQQWITDEGVIDIRFEENQVVEKHFLPFYVDPDGPNTSFMDRIRKWFAR